MEIFLSYCPKINADGRFMTLGLRKKALANGTKSYSYHGEATFSFQNGNKPCIDLSRSGRLTMRGLNRKCCLHLPEMLSNVLSPDWQSKSKEATYQRYHTRPVCLYIQCLSI